MEGDSNRQTAEVLLALLLAYGLLAAVCRLFFEDDAPLRGAFSRWRHRRNDEKRRRRDEALAKRRREEEAKRLAAIRYPTKEELVERESRQYESDIEIIDGTLLSEVEKEYAKEDRKRRYMRRLEELI